MQTMLETMVAKGSVGVKLIQPEDMAAVDEDDREDDREAARAAKQRQREREAEEDRAAVEALILIDPRHREIFDWLLRIEGKTAAQLLKEILRSALIRERPAYREAHGKGGNSSRDIGALAERLPGKK